MQKLQGGFRHLRDRRTSGIELPIDRLVSAQPRRQALYRVNWIVLGVEHQLGHDGDAVFISSLYHFGIGITIEIPLRKKRLCAGRFFRILMMKGRVK